VTTAFFDEEAGVLSMSTRRNESSARVYATGSSGFIIPLSEETDLRNPPPTAPCKESSLLYKRCTVLLI
jgi:hypothetical protein